MIIITNLYFFLIFQLMTLLYHLQRLLRKFYTLTQITKTAIGTVEILTIIIPKLMIAPENGRLYR
ncbi:hypothetical protein ABF87_14330 [Nitrosomonas sp. JL21]|nr:hypothetical protein [Nitrosomonas sp. JL21]